MDKKKNKKEKQKDKNQKNQPPNKEPTDGFPEDIDFKRFLGCGG